MSFASISFPFYKEGVLNPFYLLLQLTSLLIFINYQISILFIIISILCVSAFTKVTYLQRANHCRNRLIPLQLLSEKSSYSTRNL